MTLPRILVVEDNDANAAFVSQQLRDGGLTPEVVRGGLDALRRAHAQSYTLAVVDVDIRSDPDGVETADWLRRLYGVPVIVFSLKGASDIRHRAEQAGSDGYLEQGDLGELAGMVSRVLPNAMRPWHLRPGNLAAAAAGATRVADSPLSVAPSPTSLGRTTHPPGFLELSGTEWQIIRDLIDTPSARAVAVKRQRSPHTVHNHLKSIFRKLRVHSVAELLSLMIRVSRQVTIL